MKWVASDDYFVVTDVVVVVVVGLAFIIFHFWFFNATASCRVVFVRWSLRFVSFRLSGHWSICHFIDPSIHPMLFSNDKKTSFSDDALWSKIEK